MITPLSDSYIILFDNGKPILKSRLRRSFLKVNHYFIWEFQFKDEYDYNSLELIQSARFEFILDISTQVDADSVSLSKKKISGYKIEYSFHCLTRLTLNFNLIKEAKLMNPLKIITLLVAIVSVSIPMSAPAAGKHALLIGIQGGAKF